MHLSPSNLESAAKQCASVGDDAVGEKNRMRGVDDSSVGSGLVEKRTKSGSRGTMTNQHIKGGKIGPMDGKKKRLAGIRQRRLIGGKGRCLGSAAPLVQKKAATKL